MKKRIVAILLSTAMILEGTCSFVGAAEAETSAVDTSVISSVAPETSAVENEEETPVEESTASETSETAETDSTDETAVSAFIKDDHAMISGSWFSGAYTATVVAENEEISAREVTAAADENGNGILDIALPENCPAQFSVVVSASGETVYTASFDASLQVTDLAAENDGEGNIEVSYTENDAADTYEVMAYTLDSDVPVYESETKEGNVTIPASEDEIVTVAVAPVSAADTTVFGEAVVVPVDVMLTAAGQEFKVTPTKSENYLYLSWPAYPDAKKYTVLINEEEKLTTADQMYYETSILPGDYNCEVKAFSDTDEQIASASASVTVTGKTLGQVTGVTASLNSTVAKVSWTAVANASGYYIYDSGKLVKTITSQSTTSAILTSGTNHVYTIAAYMNVSNHDPLVGELSTAVTAKQVSKPAATASLSVTDSSKKNVLTWKAVSGAAGYYVYRKVSNAADSKYTKIATVKGASNVKYTDSVSVSTRYKYMVKAYLQYASETPLVGAGKEVIAAGTTTLTTLQKSIHAIYYVAVAKSAAPVYASTSSKAKKIGSVKKGAKFTVVYRRLGGRCTVQFSDGSRGYINQQYITFKKEIYDSKTDYTAAQTETYMNLMGYKSSTKYLIWVSTYKQRVYVFQGSQYNWKRIKSFKCATGKMSTPTHLGACKIIGHLRRKGDHNYENYWTLWAKTTPTGFHSLIHKPNGSYSSTKTGKPLSHSCVRLWDKDAYYIYSKMPMSTYILRY